MTKWQLEMPAIMSDNIVYLWDKTTIHTLPIDSVPFKRDEVCQYYNPRQ